MRQSAQDGRPRRRHRRRDDRGESLIELLVAMAIMSTAVIALVAGIGTAIRISDIHRKQATAGSYVRSYSEAVQSAIADTPTAYAACATSTTYQSAYTVPDPTRYQAEITAVTYWDGTGFVATCPATDLGLQRVSLRVRSLDGRASETLDVVIRRPCRSAADFPLDPPCT